MRFEYDSSQREGRPRCIHDNQSRYGAAVSAASYVTQSNDNNLRSTMSVLQSTRMQATYHDRDGML